MLTQIKPAETWQTLMELRCRREVLERWLASQVLPDALQHSLRTMLSEVEDQIQALASGRG
jgi:primase-polymerase (primpol)-like protein